VAIVRDARIVHARSRWWVRAGRAVATAPRGIGSVAAIVASEKDAPNAPNARDVTIDRDGVIAPPVAIDLRAVRNHRGIHARDARGDRVATIALVATIARDVTTARRGVDVRARGSTAGATIAEDGMIVEDMTTGGIATIDGGPADAPHRDAALDPDPTIAEDGMIVVDATIGGIAINDRINAGRRAPETFAGPMPRARRARGTSASGRSSATWRGSRRGARSSTRRSLVRS
jgi:hypothetical protein